MYLSWKLFLMGSKRFFLNAPNFRNGFNFRKRTRCARFPNRMRAASSRQHRGNIFPHGDKIATPGHSRSSGRPTFVQCFYFSPCELEISGFCSRNTENPLPIPLKSSKNILLIIKSPNKNTAFESGQSGNSQCSFFTNIFVNFTKIF